MTTRVIVPDSTHQEVLDDKWGAVEEPAPSTHETDERGEYAECRSPMERFLAQEPDDEVAYVDGTFDQIAKGTARYFDRGKRRYPEMPNVPFFLLGQRIRMELRRRSLNPVDGYDWETNLPYYVGTLRLEMIEGGQAAKEMKRFKNRGDAINYYDPDDCWEAFRLAYMDVIRDGEPFTLAAELAESKPVRLLTPNPTAQLQRFVSICYHAQKIRGAGVSFFFDRERVAKLVGPGVAGRTIAKWVKAMDERYKLLKMTKPPEPPHKCAHYIFNLERTDKYEPPDEVAEGH